jgi:hypothetical protein
VRPSTKRHRALGLLVVTLAGGLIIAITRFDTSPSSRCHAHSHLRQNRFVHAVLIELVSGAGLGQAARSLGPSSLETNAGARQR